MHVKYAVTAVLSSIPFLIKYNYLIGGNKELSLFLTMSVNTIINITHFNNKYHNNKNINGTLARDDVSII